ISVANSLGSRSAVVLMASSPELSVFGDSAIRGPVLTPVSNRHHRDSELLMIVTKTPEKPFTVRRDRQE
ncbi:hypothetical protein, partial [Kutzneria kofuensis]|uniref:hypothetical protein n=1 Tax=Kutzneria kofuensis TaxID=103725 RepID=UPI0031EBCE5E